MNRSSAEWGRGARRLAACLAISMLAGVLGCATSAAPSTEARGSLAAPAAPSGNQRITYSSRQNLLGIVVRELGRLADKGLVLMNGIENVFVGPYDFKKTPLDTIVRRLAADAKCRVQTYPEYYFVYPGTPLYEVLTHTSVQGLLPDAFRELKVDLGFSAGTPLFNCFALIGLSAGITLVADNALAAAQTGEVVLNRVSLETAVESLLRSARIQMAAFRIETGEDYAFLRSANNPSRSQWLLNREDLDSGQRARLETRISLRLPATEGSRDRFEARRGAQTLGDALPALSTQLGIEVTAQPELEGLPVNPVVMNGVSLDAALGLIIRQWLAPDFGYELTGQGVVIRSAARPSSPW